VVGLLGRVISPSKGLYLRRTTQHRKTRDKHPCLERDSNPRSQQPTGQDPRLRPHGYCDRPFDNIQSEHLVASNSLCYAVPHNRYTHQLLFLTTSGRLFSLRFFLFFPFFIHFYVSVFLHPLPYFIPSFLNMSLFEDCCLLGCSTV
jgi:hypothetical protein